MAPTMTPNSKTNHGGTLIRTPQSRQRLQYNSAKIAHPSPNPTVKEASQIDHPVEVIGRIRDYPDKKEKPASILQIHSEQNRFRVKTDIGYRDFSLDGVSLSEEEDLDAFYKKFVESRITSVKMGEKCTIMMYGPTGSGKSHTMFGCPKQPGIVYKSLKDILGEEDGDEDGNRVRVGTFVQVSVLEIYNEEIYDLLLSNGGGGLWSKGGSASKVKLEVMGKKAKNATFLSGNEAGKISKEIQKVEKRRIVKSTLCNERSSRSHCMIILDVPTVGGRLMLVDMAGSENIEQAGQIGFEAKMQTAKINQGNIALKRVVESIANGDSHVPFRDSKLTMLLQDSFEDDKSKILMILCASPDPKEMYKTISTLEYGAKAKCIIRGPHTPIKDKVGSEDSSAVILGSRLAAMDQFIYKLQMENKLKEKERNEAHKELMKKEEEIAVLRGKLEFMEEKGPETSEEVINLKVNERTRLLKLELEKKLEECQRMTSEFVELERRRMEERILQQQQENELLKRRLEEIELELRTRDGNVVAGSKDMDGSGFAKRLMGIYHDDGMDMVKSMELDMGDLEPVVRVVKQTQLPIQIKDNGGNRDSISISRLSELNQVDDHDVFAPIYADRVCLSTVFEEEELDEEGENEQIKAVEDEEVKKEIIEEERVFSSNCPLTYSPLSSETTNLSRTPDKDAVSSRRLRIQNIFTLCGNYRELSHHNMMTPVPSKSIHEDAESESIPEITTPALPLKSNEPASKTKAKEDMSSDLKENAKPVDRNIVGETQIFVKWEASKKNPQKPVITLTALENKMPLTPMPQQVECLSPSMGSTPYITTRKHKVSSLNMVV